MSEENQSSNLDVSDLDNLMRAVKHAHSKGGAYTMEEAAQLFPVVKRVEAWLEAYNSQLEAAEAVEKAKTMPMPKEPASAPTSVAEADALKTKQVKTKKQKK